jgi:hypothetical protein
MASTDTVQRNACRNATNWSIAPTMSAGMSEKGAGRRKSIAAADMTEVEVAAVITVAITADTELTFSRI